MKAGNPRKIKTSVRNRKNQRRAQRNIRGVPSGAIPLLGRTDEGMPSMRRSTALILSALALGGFAGCSSSTGSEDAPQSKLVIGEFLWRSGSDTLEWIELRNDGAAPARLAGVKVAGAGWTFADSVKPLPSGARVVLANSAPLFAARHPGVALVGVFGGRLSDEGERLALESEGKTLFETTWSPDEPWPQASARDGASMVWLGGDPRDPASWGASADAGGTPGRPDLAALDPGVLVSEVLPSASGFVELWNTSARAVDLGGWILRDDAVLPESLAIAAGVSIPAGGRLVFSANPSGPSLSWGRLSPSRAGGRLTLVKRGAGVAHALSWPALPEGVSWARLGLRGSGPLAVPSPGAGESSVSPGEAYVSEICYHPANGPEFVEIASLSDATIRLGDPDSLLSWSLEGAALRFSATDTIPPRGRILVATGTGLTESGFRAAVGAPADVPVVLAAGRLDDAGETLVLARPLLPATTSSGALVWRARTVDAATWLPRPPWPAGADGGGACLQRVDPSVPGDSPLAWKASAPSAGR